MARFFVGPLVGRITDTTEAFWNSPYYFPVTLAVTAVSLLTGNVVPSTVALALLCGWMLMFCRDILAAATPFLMVFLLSTVKYDSLAVFLPCAPLAVLPIGGLLVHFLRWRAPITVGRSGPGLAAVSIATLLGGLGTIPAKEYFSPLSLYYTLGLGLGLLVTYVLLRSDLAAPRLYDLLQRLMQMLYTLGLAMVLAIGCFYMGHWAEFAKSWEIPPILFRNFAATVLVSTLPAAFYMARRSRLHLMGVLLWALALFFTGSRTALLFGSVMMLLGMLYLVRWKKLPLWIFFAVLVTAAVAVLLFGQQIYELFFGCRGDMDFINPHESRWALLTRGLQDFLHHPVFGVGLGNQKNHDIFTGVPGSMVFYHNSLLQILGSMGLMGLAAYGTLLWGRVRLLLRGGEAAHLVGLFYLGMQLTSLTNPGLFCPLPSAMLTVLVFAVLERYMDDPAYLPGRTIR